MTVTMDWVVRHDDLPRIIARIPVLADQIVTKAAMDIEAQAKTRAPVDTGNLKNSIQAVRIGIAHWKVVVGAHYGMYVEWGTRFMAAQPFLQPAVNIVRPQFLAALRKVTR